MKIVKTLILSLFWIQSFSQNIDSLFSRKNLPDDLVVVIKTDYGTFPGFPALYTSVVTFESAGTSVYYYVFPYQPSDLIDFRNGEESYWMVSGCNVVPNEDFNKNFESFTMAGYYFLLQRCSCRTGENENCAELAKRINQWSKEFKQRTK